jgi:transglutaminase-like putative cysteine protease
VRISIRHRTEYVFDAPVVLEPHVVRLRPRGDASQYLLSYELTIDPTPTVRAENFDLDGNVVTQVWFEGTTDRLRVESAASVETLVTDPFRFLLDEPARTLPDVYQARLRSQLAAYRKAPEALAASVAAFAAGVAADVSGRVDEFPRVLVRRLHRDHRIERRPEGPPLPAETTLKERRGACRDLAVLFMECCQAAGLAARFVSGYAHTDESGDHDLHAWCEVYVPGGGWRGYDAVTGLAVADRHVALAAAAEPVRAAPVSGSYRGSATATFTAGVDVVQVQLQE